MDELIDYVYYRELHLIFIPQNCTFVISKKAFVAFKLFGFDSIPCSSFTKWGSTIMPLWLHPHLYSAADGTSCPISALLGNGQF